MHFDTILSNLRKLGHDRNGRASSLGCQPLLSWLTDSIHQAAATLWARFGRKGAVLAILTDRLHRLAHRVLIRIALLGGARRWAYEHRMVCRRRHEYEIGHSLRGSGRMQCLLGEEIGRRLAMLGNGIRGPVLG